MEDLSKNQEKRSAVFMSPLKPLKLILNREKNNDYRTIGARMLKLNGNIIFPIVQDRDELQKCILNIFGKKFDVQLRQYVFPKRFIYTRTLLKGVVRKIIEKPIVQGKVKTIFPTFKGQAMSKLIADKNTIIDYTDILPFLILKQPEILKRASMKLYSQYIIPEIICRLALEDEESFKNNRDKYTLTKGLEIYHEGQLNLWSSGKFENIIIPYRVTLDNAKALTLPYFAGEQKLTAEMKSNGNTIYDLGLFNFLCKLISGEIMDDSSEYAPNLAYFYKLFNTRNPVFYFYCSKFGFVFDINYLKTTRKMSALAIIKELRKRIILIARYNANELSDEEKEAEIGAELDDEEQETIPSNENQIETALKN